MNRRSDARRVALQMLYLVDQNSEQDPHWIRQKIEDDLNNEQLSEFAWSLFSAVRENQSEIDELIVGVAKNWKLHRMAITDRNLLRLGVCEIQHLKSPIPVVLNECIELAKEFGTENSASFVNGLLDKISSVVDTPGV
ncbi:MAG: transcription antitermination factor NusB [Fuerstiella sp.]